MFSGLVLLTTVADRSGSQFQLSVHATVLPAVQGTQPHQNNVPLLNIVVASLFSWCCECYDDSLRFAESDTVAVLFRVSCSRVANCFSSTDYTLIFKMCIYPYRLCNDLSVSPLIEAEIPLVSPSFDRSINSYLLYPPFPDAVSGTHFLSRFKFRFSLPSSFHLNSFNPHYDFHHRPGQVSW